MLTFLQSSVTKLTTVGQWLKNSWRLLCILWISSFLAACVVTNALNRDTITTYEENVSSILVSPTGQVVAVLTDKHHYIFEKVDALTSFLSSPLHKMSKASFTQFEVRGQNIKGNVIITLANDVDAKQAIEMGFVLTPYYQYYGGVEKKTEFYQKEFKLVGTRYKADDKFSALASSSQSQALNQTYSIFIQEYEPPGFFALAATPLAWAADGLIMFVGLPLYQLMGGEISWK